MKKILFVLPWLALGGLERVQVTIANALVHRGYDVTVLVLENRLDLKDELDCRVHLLYKPPKTHNIMRHIPYVRNKFYDDGMWETRASAKSLYKYYVGNTYYDVEIGFFRGLSVKIISGSTNAHSKKIAWVHNDFKICGGVTNNFKTLDDTKRAYSKYDTIVCVSRKAMESFNDVIGLAGKTRVVYNMLTTQNILYAAKEPINVEKNKLTVLSVGHLIEQKGYDRLLNAVKRLNGDGFCFDLWIAGYGDDEEKLKEFANKNKLSNITFLGYQKNPYKFMSRADLYVCSSRYEGFNLTVAEALILEKPVISTDCTGPSEILDGGKYGVLVDNSEEGLYNGIRGFLENRQLLNEYHMKAIMRKTFFDQNIICNEIIKIFEGNKYDNN